MKLSLYKSLLTGRRTMFVASQGQCGYEGFIEYQVLFRDGQWLCYKTDGYKLDLVRTFPGDKGLKSVLSLIWNS